MTVECQWCGDEIVDDPEYTNPRLGFEWCSPGCMRGFMLTGFEQSVGRWSHKNFGSQPASYPLLGAIEEMGELADCHTHRGTKVGTVAHLASALGQLSHSVLKQAQGIREDEQEVGPAASQQAVRRIARVAAGWDETRKMGTELPLKDNRGTYYAQEDAVDAVGDITTYLADYCSRAQIATLGECVEFAWDDEVSDRDWDSDWQTDDDDVTIIGPDFDEQ